MADRLQGLHRVLDGQVHRQRAGLDHRQHQGRRADLEVGGPLGQVRVTDDHVQPAVLVGVGVRLVPGVDDRALERGLQPHLDLEEVGPLGELEALGAPVGAQPDPAGAGEHLPGHEERDQPADDLDERGPTIHQVVLVRTVGLALAVGVVLVQLDRQRARHLGRPPGGLHHDPLAGLVPQHDVPRAGYLGRGVLGVRVVDVEPGPVGQHHVGHAGVLVGVAVVEGAGRREVETTGVAQRGLLLEVPPGPAPGRCTGRRPGVHDLAGQRGRVRPGLTRDRDAVLQFGPHDPPHAHAGHTRRAADHAPAAP